MADENNAEFRLTEPNMIKRSLYITTLDSLPLHMNEIKTIFANRTNTDGNIKTVEELDQLINDLNELLSSDLGDIVAFLTAEIERINSK